MRTQCARYGVLLTRLTCPRRIACVPLFAGELARTKQDQRELARISQDWFR